MHYYEVAPRIIVRTDQDFFTYSSEKALVLGQLVMIEVGRRRAVGVVLGETTRPSFKTKPIVSVIEERPLPQALVKLSQWLAVYYASHLASTLQAILPQGLDKKRHPAPLPKVPFKRQKTTIRLTKEQSAAINTITKQPSGTFLLQGVTGSGKTEIYIRLAKQAAQKGKSTIVLVPEISLTPQLIGEFAHHFDNLLVTHSEMGEAARHRVWQEALDSDNPRVVIGPRSALFTPLRKVGVIIVDEAHEPGFKQEQAPKYSALRAATMLGRFHKAKVVFGSATPSVADRYLAEQSERPILHLTKPARDGSTPPEITVLDMTKRDDPNDNHPFLSKQLLEDIQKTLQDGKQVLIFHNRRGSAKITLCKKCSWVGECPRCIIPLTLHVDQHRLRCHICNYVADVPTACPVCTNVDIIHKGVGTKLIQSELGRLFPKAVIERFDADSKIKDLSDSYSKLYSGQIDIAVGTQVLAKGLDLPHLRMVGVIQADTGLSLPDFSSEERTFQLLYQVIGRVGRAAHPTKVIVQSYRITHPSIMNGTKQDYQGFYEHALAERRKANFPPFTYLLKLTCTYKTEVAAIKNAQSLTQELESKTSSNVSILGPAPAFYERRNGSYRWQLVLKSPKRLDLVDALKLVPQKNWHSELDPSNLL